MNVKQFVAQFGICVRRDSKIRLYKVVTGRKVYNVVVLANRETKNPRTELTFLRRDEMQARRSSKKSKSSDRNFLRHTTSLEPTEN